MDLSTSHKILYRLKGLSVLLIIIAISLSFSFNYQDIQAKEMFSTEDRFEFPENNGVLQFANVGEYDSAKYENSFWKFENLRLNYSLGTRAVPFSSQEFSFDISVKDSSVTIFSCRNYNSTFGAMPVKGAWIGYNTVNKGTQSFDLGFETWEGEYSVVLEDIFLGKGDGWSVSSEGIVTITGLTGNITLFFWGHPEPYIDTQVNSSSFLEQHYVIISIGIVVFATCSVALIVRPKKRNIGSSEL